MKLLSIAAALASAATASANTSASPCLADCRPGTGEFLGQEVCTFEVSRDQYASELGYFKFKGANGLDCGGTNPTLGM